MSSTTGAIIDSGHAAVGSTSSMRQHLESMQRQHVLNLGMWMFLATVTMLYAAFSSAYLVRGASQDWMQVAVPGILGWNTLLLALSSVAVEIGRRNALAGRWGEGRTWLVVASVLGLAFLAGQVGAWRQLVVNDISWSTTPHSSFFYILSGTHALHVVGAWAFLATVTALIGDHRREPVARLGLVRRCATFWHFLAVLWVYLLGVLQWV